MNRSSFLIPIAFAGMIAGTTRDYQVHVLTEILRDKLRKGTNTIALHSHKQRTATYLDLAILIDNAQ